MAPMDTSYFSEKARKELLHLLDTVPGKKNLVLQRTLVGPTELLVSYSTLQENGIDRIFFLENDNVDSSQRNIIFIAWAEKAKQASSIASQIKRLRASAKIDHDYTVLWVPRRTLVCEKILEDQGVLGEVTSLEWPLYFQPLEDDFLSLELDESFGELYLRKDPTSIFLAAKALMLIQKQHGLFPRIIGKGDQARRLADLLIRMRSEYSAEGGTSRDLMPSTTIDNIIIIDREVDFATPLLTQLTYEGLIDEMFGISQSQAEVDSSIVGAAPQIPAQGSSTPAAQSTAPLKRKIKLDSNDKLYDQLRDANFAIVGSLLNKIARRLQTDFEARHGQKTVSELRDFVNKIPGFQAEQQSLKIHTGLTEEVLKQTKSEVFLKSLEIQQNVIAGTDPTSLNEMVEDLIARDCSLSTVLRLLCLESVVGGGLRAKDFDNFRLQIAQAYGYQHIVTLDALEKMQLLVPAKGGGVLYIPGTGGNSGTSAGTNYSSIRKPLQLIMDEVSDTDPNDIAYVFSGYAPLSVRLVQSILQKPYLQSLGKPISGGTGSSVLSGDASQGWRGFEDILKHIKGVTFDEVQSSGDGAVKARQILTGHGERKTTIVFFLGGITFAEIAALRFVANQEEDRRRIVIATTSIIRGDKMMQIAIDAGRPTKTS